LGGYLYVADTSNSNIRRVALGDSASGSSYTYEGQPAKWVQAADGAVGIYAAISTPSAITTDGTYLYVANSGANNIIKIAVDGSSDSVVIAGLNDPKGITTDGTYLYVSDSSNYKVKKVLISTPALVTVAGTGAIAPANTDAVGTLATFDLPYGITTDGKNIYVVDSANFNIRKIQ
jgi:sugar lactone lactonase YvrE